MDKMLQTVYDENIQYISSIYMQQTINEVPQERAVACES